MSSVNVLKEMTANLTKSGFGRDIAGAEHGQGDKALYYSLVYLGFLWSE